MHNRKILFFFLHNHQYELDFFLSQTSYSITRMTQPNFKPNLFTKLPSEPNPTRWPNPTDTSTHHPTTTGSQQLWVNTVFTTESGGGGCGRRRAATVPRRQRLRAAACAPIATPQADLRPRSPPRGTRAPPEGTHRSPSNRTVEDKVSKMTLMMETFGRPRPRALATVGFQGWGLENLLLLRRFYQFACVFRHHFLGISINFA